MNWQDLGAAIALFLVLEGMIPFISPHGMRRVLEQIAALPDAQLRFAGLTSMLLGVIVLYVIRF